MKTKKPSSRPTVGVRVSSETLASIDALADKAGVSRCAMAEELLLVGLSASGVDVQAVSAEAREARRMALEWTASLARVVHAAAEKMARGEEP